MVYIIEHLKFAVFSPRRPINSSKKQTRYSGLKKPFAAIVNFYSTPPVFPFSTLTFPILFSPVYSHLINIHYLATEYFLSLPLV